MLLGCFLNCTHIYTLISSNLSVISRLSYQGLALGSIEFQMVVVFVLTTINSMLQ